MLRLLRLQEATLTFFTLMAALAALFILGFFFGGHEESKPTCPLLKSEVIQLYSEPEVCVGDICQPLERPKVEPNNPHNATTTLGSFKVSGEGLTLDPNAKMVVRPWGHMLGTTTDQEAIAYNKRVEECRTKNGEF
jgi:hypothetical protein